MARRSCSSRSLIAFILVLAPVCQADAQVRGQGAAVASLAFAPDRKTVAVGTLDGKLRLLEVPGLREVFSTDADPNAVYAVAFSPDGKILATAGIHREIRLWDPATGQEQRRLKGHTDRVAALAFSKDGKLLASGGYDKTIRVWDVANGETLHRLNNKDHAVTSLAFAADGRQLLAGGAGPMVRIDQRQNVFGTSEASRLRLWQIADAKYREFAGQGHSVALGSGGEVLVGGGLLVDVRRHRRGTSYNGLDRIVLLNAAGERILTMDWQGYLVAVSLDGKWLATGAGDLTHYQHGILGGGRYPDSRTRVWDLAGPKEILRLPENDATAIAFSEDKRYLATGNSGGQVRLWDVEKERRDPTPDPYEIVTKPPPEDKLLTQLDADFEMLLKKDKQPDRLRQAHKWFHQGKHYEALEELRLIRSPAGVPLLLRYWVESKNVGWNEDLYVKSFLTLTGNSLEPTHPRRKGVEKLVASWWQPERITTALADFSQEQLQAVADGLTEIREQDHHGSMAYRLHSQLQDSLDTPLEGFRTWWEQDLHPRMVDILLARAGYANKPEPGTRGHHRIPFSAIPLLGALGKQGEAARLAEIAQDQRQNSAVRLTALLAHHLATGQLLTPTLQSLAGDEKRLEPRVVAILALELAPTAEAIKSLHPCLDDSNRNVREGALFALRPHKPAAALPRLKFLLQDRHPEAPLDATLAVLAGIRTKEAQTILAQYLNARLEEGGHYTLLWNALFAFQEATGQSWTNPRDTNDAYYRDAARRAVSWWRKNNPS